METSQKEASKEAAEKEKEEFMQQGNISLIIDSYDDIFSDFDPRPFNERTLSDDFLVECKKAVRDRKEPEFGFELRILTPNNIRSINDELKIRKRIKNYFQKRLNEKEKETYGLRNEGIIWFIFGVIFILIATYIGTFNQFIFRFLFVIFEPAGWFTIWSGLDKIFIETKEKKPEIEFYRKMNNLQIIFTSY